MFTGDETSENLTVSFFEKDWTPSDPSGKTLIQGQEGEWNWFPSGADRSRDFGVWANVYHNMPYQGTFADDATIELAVFDQNLEFSQHFDVGGTDYHAADVTSRNACLYVAVAWADVTIDQYRIKAPDGYEDGETTCGAAR